MGFKNTFIDANSACCSKQDENNNLILHKHEYSQKLNLSWVVTIVGSKYVACCSKYNKNSKYILYVNTYEILIHYVLRAWKSFKVDSREQTYVFRSKIA